MLGATPIRAPHGRFLGESDETVAYGCVHAPVLVRTGGGVFAKKHGMMFGRNWFDFWIEELAVPGVPGGTSLGCQRDTCELSLVKLPYIECLSDCTGILPAETDWQP